MIPLINLYENGTNEVNVKILSKNREGENKKDEDDNIFLKFAK